MLEDWKQRNKNEERETADFEETEKQVTNETNDEKVPELTRNNSWANPWQQEGAQQWYGDNPTTGFNPLGNVRNAPAQKVSKQQLRPVTDPGALRDLFEEMDLNGDGEVCRSEVLLALRRNEKVRARLGLPARFRPGD